jgi:hypothetical protein
MDARQRCLLLAIVHMLLSPLAAASYLGCFNVNNHTCSIISHQSAWTASQCEARCQKGQHPLFGLAAQNTQCMCGSDIPNGIHQLNDDHCIYRTVESLALHYSHHGGCAMCHAAVATVDSPERAGQVF